jgi:hypothetical protein
LESCKDPVITEIGIIIHAEKVTLQDMSVSEEIAGIRQVLPETFSGSNIPGVTG